MTAPVALLIIKFVQSIFNSMILARHLLQIFLLAKICKMCWHLDYNVDGVEFQIVVTRKAMCLQTIIVKDI